MSKDLKPKQRLGQAGREGRQRALSVILLLAVACGGYAYFKYGRTKKVEVAVARVRKGEFILSLPVRGELKSTHSVILAAPQVPDPTIVRLASSGRAVKKGDVVVEFDSAQQEQNLLEEQTNVRTVDSQVVQLKASQKMTNESDAMSMMTATYNVQRADLEASKAEILSEIEGAKNRIGVGIAKGELTQLQAVVNSHTVSQEADLARLDNQRRKTVRDMDRAQGYLTKLEIRAPIDGIVNILPNFRAQGSWGRNSPPFKEGDSAWTGAAIAEIPDLSEMRLDLDLDEVDRGKIKLGQTVKITIDAIPDQEFEATLDWISPIATVIMRGPGSRDKVFSARATLKRVDDRLRQGMSSSARVIIESAPNVLLIPMRANFTDQGKPAVYIQQGKTFVIRHIVVGERNDNDVVVLSGLKAGDVVALENPKEAAQRAGKL